MTACDTCGAVVEGDPPLTWSVATGPRGTTFTCERCTRENVRAIEAKLEQEWW